MIKPKWTTGEIVRRDSLSAHMAGHVILGRPSDFRADLSSSGNRVISDGVDNALKNIIYQRTSVNSQYGRIGDCTFSDLMAHVRG